MMAGVLFLFSCQDSQFNRGKYAINHEIQEQLVQ